MHVQWQLAPSPRRARWLSPAQQQWLQQRQDAERAATQSLAARADKGSATELPSKWAAVRADLRAVAGALSRLPCLIAGLCQRLLCKV